MALPLLFNASRSLLRPHPRVCPTFSARHFHSTPSSYARKRLTRPETDDFDGEELEGILDDNFDDDDSASLGHMMLRQQREVLYYMRLIEHEMPKLVAYRKPFIPPEGKPLIVRSLNYGGEEHPATIKRVVVVAVDKLPLRDAMAVHKIKLLAGPRWSEKPPSDGGAPDIEPWGNGYIKISCEDFPKPAQNLKWASDTLDRLIAEANDTTKDRFRNVPLDLRHIYSKARKAKTGEHLRGRINDRPTLHDFPLEWLPPRRQ